MEDHAYPCPMCLSEAGMQLKFDKKTRPYLSCTSCGMRAFLRGELSLNGLAILSPVILEITQRMRTEPGYYGSMRGAVDALLARVRALTSPSGVPSNAHGSSAVPQKVAV